MNAGLQQGDDAGLADVLPRPRPWQHSSMAEDDVRRTWKIPYVAIDSLSTEPGVQAYEPPPEPAAQAAIVAFKVGDKATLDDGKGLTQVGMVTRINRRTATPQAMDGRSWRVGFELLRHVFRRLGQEGSQATLTLPLRLPPNLESAKTKKNGLPHLCCNPLISFK